MKTVQRTLIFLLVLAGQSLFAQTIDKPAATVALIRMEVITASRFKHEIETFERRAGKALARKERTQILELLINEILIRQAAERQHMSVAGEELNVMLAAEKRNLESRVGREITDEEFQVLIEQITGTSWAAYRNSIEKTLLIQKYVLQTKQAHFESIKRPDEEEIRDFYIENRTSFVSPEMVKAKHVFIDTRSLTTKEGRDKARQRAENIHREYQNGRDFDELVVAYSDDHGSRYRGGELDYFRRGDESSRQVYGAEFIDSAFGMQKEEVSGVIRSNLGFHIVKITDIIPFQLLSLDSDIPPEYRVTVEDYIRATLYQERQAQAYQTAMQELIWELRAQADVTIFESDFS